MKISIVYDSRTGTTAKAAQAMGKVWQGQGHECRVQPVAEADPASSLASPSIDYSSWVVDNSQPSS